MTFIIGDIHGCNRTFQALLERLDLGETDQLVLLGDYIDRGPDSKGVIDTILRLRESGRKVACLRGNHEQLLLDAQENPGDIEMWLVNGGRQTMASFEADRTRDIPQAYIDFFKSTLLFHEVADCLCVHGGLDFFKPNPLEDAHALLWARRWYADIDYDWLGRRIVVHGHTPTEIEVIREQCKNLDRQRYLNLDNGCVYADKTFARGEGLGRLLGFCLETRQLTEQKNVDYRFKEH